MSIKRKQSSRTLTKSILFATGALLLIPALTSGYPAAAQAITGTTESVKTNCTVLLVDTAPDNAGNYNVMTDCGSMKTDSFPLMSKISEGSAYTLHVSTKKFNLNSEPATIVAIQK